MLANSEESKWMAAGSGEATESLNDLRHRIFGNTKKPTK